MNKQEINEKLKENGAWCTECHTGVTDRYVKIRKAMELVGQLDEPQKPVIDSFVAEYLNYCMANEWTLAEALDTRNVPIPSNMHKTVDWLFSSMNQNIFARAWLFGYEVEKEPLYTVTINLDRKYHLVVDEGDGNDEISTTLTTSHGVLGYRYFLTEKEIKSADENLWLIAVPVEEVAEG
ncbi:DUF1642 domain-containing protein [Enterococcus faecium]|uniref:DUF1642 domain-containing protein n=1 Tax=Enterococcus faecium TaxID=1352 RepID=UPI000FFE4782|nr:DUF1642 domain-containing protein [Enterococcus faecium]MDT2356706.1 DUF1642 domain-containing protein [Enterococcus faecium]QXJ55286.1 DUF1642 domain-containing protein [Enterococcus faecium]RXE92372.1 DUF1642 domain-containing protein [Enterococcus faecium]